MADILETNDFIYNYDKEVLTFKDISFYNTSEFTETGKYFQKHGVYTKAPKGSREYREFWDREEERRFTGMVVPGRLVSDGKGGFKIENVRITGEHYGFLNYAPIFRTILDKDDADDLSLVKKITRRQVKSGIKVKDFPDFLDGQYYYFKLKELTRKLGKNSVGAKARRKGFSYMEAWDGANAINLNPNITVLYGASDLKYITKGNQLMGMSRTYIAWLEKYTDFNRGILTLNKENIQLGYIPEGQRTAEGYLSQIIALSFGNNPDAAIGKDAYMIKLEEAGKFPNLLEALEVTLSTVEDGDVQTGEITIFGTGGTDDANWTSFQSIHSNPKKYNCLAFKNIWDENAGDTDVCGFFYPHDLCQLPHVDKHGNTLWEKSKEATAKNREIQKEQTTSQREYLRYVSQRANSPTEAFYTSSNNIFPSAEITLQLNYVDNNPFVKDLPRYGELIRTPEGEIKFMSNHELKSKGLVIHDPILDWPYKKDEDLTGCFIEYHPPYKGTDGKIPKDLYTIWSDPYGTDKKLEDLLSTDSLHVSIVFERPNNFTPTRGGVIAGIMVGRLTTQEADSIRTFNACEYYNAKVLVETNRGTMVQDARKHKKLHLLHSQPKMVWDTSLKIGNNDDYGIHINDTRKTHGAIYLKEFLEESQEIQHNGLTKLTLNRILYKPILKQLLKWNETGNFDFISALIVGMYDVRENALRPPRNKTNSVLEFFDRF